MILLVADQAEAYTFELSGPSMIHVGETVTYDAQIELAPGENLWSVTASFFVENGRELASWDVTANDSKEREGFQDTGFSVDAAAYWMDTTSLQLSDSIPLWIEGELVRPIDFVPMTADQGPFTIVPFTLTALAPGQLSFVMAQGPYPPPGTANGFITNGGLDYTFILTPYDPNTIYLQLSGGSVAPGSDGVYATITIPEPSSTALAALLGATLAIACVRIRSTRCSVGSVVAFCAVGTTLAPRRDPRIA
ncbi:MAG TPA: hypothetical protein VMR50_08580 [Myxococcota bacterium]|nr:hypothetical protein [Myxococcota bacterium]